MIEFSPLTWHRKSLQGSTPPFAGQSVPCGSCTACCERGRVVLYPQVDRVETYAHDVDERGIQTLARHPDGHCLYLHEGQCLIYMRRPMTCRLYDCRALIVADVPHPESIFRAAIAKFDLVCKHPDDRPFVAEVRRTVRTLEAQGHSPEAQLQGALYANRPDPAAKRRRQIDLR